MSSFTGAQGVYNPSSVIQVDHDRFTLMFNSEKPGLFVAGTFTVGASKVDPKYGPVDRLDLTTDSFMSRDSQGNPDPRLANVRLTDGKLCAWGPVDEGACYPVMKPTSLWVRHADIEKMSQLAQARDFSAKLSTFLQSLKFW